MLTKTIGCMATFPPRKEQLGQVVNSVSNQLDVLYVYLNEYKTVPYCLQGMSNVIPVLGSEAYGDIKANGKMYWLERERDGVVFTLDDDIIYPANYVRTMLHVLDTFDGTACLSVHGSLFNENFAYYYERQASFPMKLGFDSNNIINLVGSGTAVFPAWLYSDVKFEMGGPVYVDLHISLTALRKNLPILAVSRPENWIQSLATQGLWEITRTKISHHTAIAFENSALLSAIHLRALWFAWLDERQISLSSACRRLNLSQPSLDFLAGRDMFVRTNELFQLRKLMEFGNNLASGGGK